MANRGKKIEILDNDDNLLYPMTAANCVRFGNTGDLVGDTLENILFDVGDLKTGLTNLDNEVSEARNSKTTRYPNLKTRLDAIEDNIGTGGSTVDQEVIDARTDKKGVVHQTLKDRLDAMEDSSTTIQQTANQAQQTANQAQQTATTANNTANDVKQEIDNAKAPNATLKDKLDSINGKFNEYLPLVGGTMTGGINYDGRGEFITSTPLQQATTNGDVLTVNGGIVLGNENTQLDLATSQDLIVATGGQRHKVWHEGNLKPNTFPAIDSVVQRNASGNVNTSQSINMHSNALGTTLDDTYIGSITINPQNRNLYHSYVAPGTTQNGTNQQIWTARDFTVDTKATPNTVVKRKGDGWIDNGGSGIIVNTIRSAGINVLIGGNATDGTFTGDVVFMTNMRPTNERNVRIGSYNYRFSECWVTAGAFNTSDERCKTNIETFDIQDCFNMVKNTDVKSYTLLFGDKTKMSDNELQTATVEQDGKSAYQQLGIIAQDIVDYKCSDYILVQDNPDDLYAINPYNLASAVMGALKYEISKREELEQTVLDLTTRLEAIENKVQQLENGKQIKGTVVSSTNWNTVVEAGTYYVNNGNGSNKPTDSYYNGTLLVTVSEDTVMQIYIPQTSTKPMAYRSRWTNGVWTNWRSV